MLIRFVAFISECFAHPPTFSIFYIIPFLTLLSVSSLSFSCGYWFLLSIRASSRMQTRPSAWLPINIKNPGMVTVLFALFPCEYLPCFFWGVQSDDRCMTGILTEKNSTFHLNSQVQRSCMGDLLHDRCTKSPLHSQEFVKRLWNVQHLAGQTADYSMDFPLDSWSNHWSNHDVVGHDLVSSRLWWRLTVHSQTSVYSTNSIVNVRHFLLLCGL